MKQSKELTEFYIALNKWIESGCNPDEIFEDNQGICGNLNNWHWGLVSFDADIADFCRDELEDSFIDVGLDRLYPFNNGSRREFVSEMDNNTLYKNPKRTNWIKQHTR